METYSDIMQIQKYPTNKAKEYSIPKDKKLLNEIKFTLKDLPYNCLAISAPVLGIPLRIIVMKESYEYKFYINPKVLKKEGEQIFEEGCLCIPDKWKKVKRPRIILVEYSNQNGKRLTKQLFGQSAAIFMHQFDHLEGK